MMNFVPPPTTTAPYLSVVAASRNDNHGGDLLPRMQRFIDGLATQCEAFRLQAELVLVEWNPPADRPRLTEALAWPTTSGFLVYRVIEVPLEVHQTFDGWQHLPLIQMVAKNVGIRRAHGAFILATNIDILFSDELMALIAKQSLDSGVMYRTDRYDTVVDVRAALSHADRLQQCEAGIIRINTRSGVVPVPTHSVNPIRAKLTQLVARFKALARLAARPGRNRLPLTEHSLLLLDDLGLSGPYRHWYNRVYGPVLHLEASGDFSLLSREDWERLTGYAELSTHGLYVDALLCSNAYVLGIQEEYLPYKIYHLEHEGTWGREATGSDRKPRQVSLRQKPLITTDDYRQWQREIQQTREPKFQNPDWGFRGVEFKETNGSDLTSSDATFVPVNSEGH